MLTDMERLAKLLKEARKLGFDLEYVIDRMAMSRDDDELKPSTVKRKLGVYVADGAIPLRYAYSFYKEQSHATE